MPSSIETSIKELLAQYSAEEIITQIKLTDSANKNRVLTVVANAGVHLIPAEYIQGSIINFSEGTLDLTPDGTEETLSSLTKSFSLKLKSDRWDKIFLVPTGHPLLSIVCSLAIFRITRIEPVIVSYFGKEGYREIDINIRRWIA